MRTKTLLMTAVLSAASIATAMAQTVYSVNAVGYVNAVVPAGKFAMLANPLNLPTNSLANVLPDVPANTVVYTFNAAGGFDVSTKRPTGWTGPAAATTMLDPGKGFFIKNAGATDMTITFVGEVMQGTNLTVNIPVGFSLLGSMVPQKGHIETDLKLPAQANDKVYLFSAATQGYTTITRRPTGQWTGGDPTADVAQGFFYQATTAGKWVRSFNVNQ